MYHPPDACAWLTAFKDSVDIVTNHTFLPALGVLTAFSSNERRLIT
jgi:hypothetical protein